jgi:glutamate-5-semialdehyde dehydrogenase
VAIAKVLSESAEKAGVPAGAITFVERAEREIVQLLLKQDRYIDLIIPRGGESLMRTIAEHATIPVLKHDKGVCHTYVDVDADPQVAERICLNAKVQRPSTCNAMETLLVHHSIARTWLPLAGREAQSGEGGTSVVVRRPAQLCPEVTPAAEDDFGREFLDLVLAIKVVKNDG